MPKANARRKKQPVSIRTAMNKRVIHFLEEHTINVAWGFGVKYAGNAANPLNYSFVFVLAMAAGAFVSTLLKGGIGQQERRLPAVWRANFGDTPWKHYAVAFAGGFVVLYGARLAGGCTSGHMMSGMMQTSLSGYIFALGAFLAAVPTALFMYRED